MNKNRIYVVTTDPFAYTDLAGMIGEVWTPMILEEMQAKAVAANFFTDISAFCTGGGDIFHIPGVFTNSFSLGTQSTQGAELTTESVADDDKTITVNTHNYVAFVLGDKDIKQMMSMYDANAIYTKKAAGTLRIALEDALFALWSGITTAVGDTATVLSDAEIRTGIETLEASDFEVLDGDAAFFFHPYTYWVQLGAVSKYYDQGSRGPLTTPGMTATGGLGEGMPTLGFKGTLYGIPVYTTSRVVSGLQTYRNLLARKEALGYAVQTLVNPNSPSYAVEGGNVRAQSSYELRNLGWLTVVDIIFGVAVLRPTAAIVLNGSSAFIGS
jgi:hypothetical protein